MKCPTCHYEAIADGTVACPRCLTALDSSAASRDLHLEIDIDVSTVADGGAVTGATVAQARDVYIDVDPRKAAQLRRNRLAFLNLVWNAWIEGVLEKIEATHTAVTNATTLIPLNKQLVPEAVQSPSDARDAIAHLVDDVAVPNTDNETISDIFESNGRSLLILGQPGAGKTVGLLQIARDYLRLAWRDPQAPIPVVLNLASWAQKKLPLAQWLADELNSPQYRIPRELVQEWLERNELLLLLDGLDEVPHALRDDCVRAINRFTRENFVGIAITSRSAEYYDIYLEPPPGPEHNQLELRQAIEMLSLTAVQIDTYLDTKDARFDPLRQLLQNDNSLREMVNTPLMLGIFCVTYRDGLSVEMPQSGQPLAETRTQLLKAYVKRMFAYGGEDDKPVSDDQTVRWLGWLAQKMKQHHITIFFIEQIQPSWLPSRRWQIAYMYASRLIITLIGGLIGGFVLGIANSLLGGDGVIPLGVIQGLLGGLIAGLVAGTVDILWVGLDTEPMAGQSHLRPAVLKFAVLSFCVWAAVTLVFALLAIPARGTALDFAISLEQGVMVGLILALSLGWVFAFGPDGVRQTLSNDIQSVERLSWSGAKARRYGLYGLLIGAIAGVLATFIARFTPLIWPIEARFGEKAIVVSVMLLLGLIFFGLAGAILGGVRGTMVEGNRQQPNEGFHMSLMNAALTGPVIGLFFGTMGALVGWLIDRTTVTMGTMALYGLFFGVIAAVWYGGLFAVQHAILRMMLAVTGKSPRLGTFTVFLNHAARRVFLRKVGGGFIFIHRYVQEHFATAVTPSDP